MSTLPWHSIEHASSWTTSCASAHAGRSVCSRQSFARLPGIPCERKFRLVQTAEQARAGTVQAPTSSWSFVCSATAGALTSIRVHAYPHSRFSRRSSERDTNLHPIPTNIVIYHSQRAVD
eukprot:763574-Hanusia_phi.AAC.6